MVDNGFNIIASEVLSATDSKDCLQDQNKKEMLWAEDVAWLQEYLQTSPIEALAYLLGCPDGQFRGCMHEMTIQENIIVAYLVAWNAAKKEKTKAAVYRFIKEHWKPFWIQLHKARTQEDRRKPQVAQDWAKETWTEQNTQLLPDGLNVGVVKAAATFFQEIRDADVDEYFESESDESDSDEAASETESESEEEDEDEESGKGGVEHKRKAESGDHAPSKKVKVDTEEFGDRSEQH